MIEYLDFITPDGVTFHLNGSCKFVTGETGFGMPPIKYIAYKGPMQHGETLLDYRLEPRTLQLEIHQEGMSRFEYWELRSALMNALRPNRQSSGQFGCGVLRKFLPNGDMRDIDVVLAQGLQFESANDRWNEHGFVDVLQFLAPNPIFYNPTAVSYSWGMTANTHLEFDVTFPITFGLSGLGISETVQYLGTWRAFPTITISGPCSAFTISNTSTEKSITLNYAVASGEDLIINLTEGNKTVTNSDGENLIGSLDPESDLSTFSLEPAPTVLNGNNDIVVSTRNTTAGVSAVALSYNERFIGI